MREALEARSGLSPEQIDTLCAFGQALIEKNKVMNLTAITEPQAVARAAFSGLHRTALQAEDFSGQARHRRRLRRGLSRRAAEDRGAVDPS